jgi:hypothetical protein
MSHSLHFKVYRSERTTLRARLRTMATMLALTLALLALASLVGCPLAPAKWCQQDCTSAVWYNDTATMRHLVDCAATLP